MQTFEHLITTRPHAIIQVFISDLHMPRFAAFRDGRDYILANITSAKTYQTPAPVDELMQAFLRLLDDLLALPNLKQLFILGDWFDAWLGDDVYLSLSESAKRHHPLTPMLAILSKLSDKGCQILVMVGNRDFLLGQAFCEIFEGVLIDEPYDVQIDKMTYRLEHGDALCTDDTAYQRYRKLTRNRWVQKGLLSLSMKRRLHIADKLRANSQSQNERKSEMIMDVNTKEVKVAVKIYDGLIHGHTHRPAVHKINAEKTRFVLGDWRITSSKTGRKQVEAVIGVGVDNDGFRLVLFNPTT